MMKYLDKYVLTEDQKKEIEALWLKLNNAQIPFDIHRIASLVQEGNLKWIDNENKKCPDCEAKK